MARIKLGLYCPGCLPGYHLPYVGAVARGLFARHGLDVEIHEPAPGSANVELVSSGALDFCITSVAHFLRARHLKPAVEARFVAVIVQRWAISQTVSA
jgi:ABC-type nitrate/sulfonate/bicarbonate transport system substrate-binding protein